MKLKVFQNYTPQTSPQVHKVDKTQLYHKPPSKKTAADFIREKDGMLLVIARA